jgi:acyl-ACP thioesterase
MSKVIQETYKIRLDEVDARHRLTPTALLGYLQEIAWEASVRFGVSIPTLMEHGLTWVLNRLRLEMDVYPQYGETFRIETWASATEKYFFYRDFRIFNQAGVLIGRATSTWLIVELAQKKMITLPAFVIEGLLTDHAEAMPPAKEKIPNLREIIQTYILTVRWNDLDINAHTNNKHYFRWALDALPAEVLREKTLKTLDVHFRNESLLTDSLTIQVSESAPNHYLHQILKAGDKKEVIRGVSVWE